jgi:hypothetical protein
VTRKVLDSWAVVGWLQGEEPARFRVSHLFKSASGHRVELMMSMINVGEVFYSLAKRRGRTQTDPECRQPEGQVSLVIR